MRFLLTLLIAVLLLGGVALCQFGLTGAVDAQFVRNPHTNEHAHEEAASDRFTVVLTPSFSAETDPFAVVTEEVASAAKIRIRAGERDLVAWDGGVKPGVVIRLEDVRVDGGHAEWFVEAAPSQADAVRSCALRVQVFQDDVLHADQTVWSEGGGAAIAERVVLDLAPQRSRLDRGLTERAR